MAISPRGEKVIIFWICFCADKKNAAFPFLLDIISKIKVLNFQTLLLLSAFWHVTLSLKKIRKAEMYGDAS